MGVVEPLTFCERVPPSLDLRVTAPAGFCVRRYASVPMARVLAFAPNGDLFVSSPGFVAAGGTGPGLGAVLRLVERGGPGLPSGVSSFVDGVALVHGIAFLENALLFTHDMRVMRAPWSPDAVRTPSAPIAVAEVRQGQRYTQTLDIGASAQVYVSFGAYDRSCSAEGETGGGVAVFDPARSDPPRVVMRGARNPMYLRCLTAGCFAMELPNDSFVQTSERLFRLDDGINLHASCCQDRDLLALGGTACADVPEPVFRIPHHSVPFGFDRAPSSWPPAWRAGWFVALHGAVGSWFGAGVAVVPDGSRGAVPPQYFSGGWGHRDGRSGGRPADVRFAPDGRLFVADDAAGGVYWFAPLTLRPAR
jgi:glucose/arabinose dehydrogenase